MTLTSQIMDAIAASQRSKDAEAPGQEADSILVSPKGNELQPETNLPFKTAADVAKAVPETVDWIVPGFAAPGVVTEIDGTLKASGKTTWIAALLRAVLTGGHLWAFRSSARRRSG